MAGIRQKPTQLPDDAYLMALEADNDRLRLRIAELEAQVSKLSDEMGVVAMTPVAAFKFTPSESNIFGRLAANGYASNADLLAVACGKSGRKPQIKIVDVYICKIRKKIEPFDIVIETLHGRGYRIGPEGLAKIAAIQSGTEIAQAG